MVQCKSVSGRRCRSNETCTSKARPIAFTVWLTSSPDVQTPGIYLNPWKPGPGFSISTISALSYLPERQWYEKLPSRHGAPSEECYQGSEPVLRSCNISLQEKAPVVLLSATLDMTWELLPI